MLLMEEARGQGRPVEGTSLLNLEQSWAQKKPDRRKLACRGEVGFRNLGRGTRISMQLIGGNADDV